MAEGSTPNLTGAPRTKALVAQLTVTLNLETGELLINGASPSPLLSIGMLEMAIEAFKNDNLQASLGKKGRVELINRGVTWPRA